MYKALFPSEPYDIGSIMSGSAVNIPGIGPVLVYTGHTLNSSWSDQSQNIAFPRDPNDEYLINWAKVSSITHDNCLFSFIYSFFFN